MVNKEYIIINEIKAYAISDYPKNKTHILYATIIPGVGIVGPEISFAILLQKGTRFVIKSIEIKHRLIFIKQIVYKVNIYNDNIPNIDYLIEQNYFSRSMQLELDPKYFDELQGR